MKERISAFFSGNSNKSQLTTMSRPVYTVIYMMAIIGAFFSLSLIYQSCGNNKQDAPTNEELEEKLIETAETYSDEDAFFEDDNGASADSEEELDYSSSEESYSSSSSSSSSSYGSSSNSTSSSEMIRKLRSAGYNDAEKVVFDLSRYYTVIAGAYGTRSLANSISSELDGRGIDNYVLRRRL